MASPPLLVFQKGENPGAQVTSFFWKGQSTQALKFNAQSLGRLEHDWSRPFTYFGYLCVWFLKKWMLYFTLNSFLVILSRFWRSTFIFLINFFNNLAIWLEVYTLLVIKLMGEENPLYLGYKFLREDLI